MAQLEPRLTVRAIWPLVSALRALGHDPAPILSAVGLVEATLTDPDARVPMSAGVGLFAHAVEQTGDSNLGLHLAQRAEPSSFDVHFYAMLSSSTLGTAYERLCQYQRLIHETSRVELVVEKGRATLRHQLSGGLAAPRQTAEFLVASWVRAGRIVTGSDWAPLEVRFAHPAPPDPNEHARFFRAAVHFAMGENTLVLPAALLETPCVGADAALVAVLDQYASDRLERAPRTNSVADRARSGLADELHGGEPTSARLAARLRMSVRTLIRLLAEEGTSYREVFDALRHELATRHLASDLNVDRGSRLSSRFFGAQLFSSGLSALDGSTPAEFRRQLRSARR